MKSLLISFFLIQILTFNVSINLDTYYKEFISNNGYNLEENPVTTKDGYILSVWHISPKNPNGKVVFFQHGLADTAWCFFQMGKKSLPFLLMEEGFDVWLGNSRGNVFSNKYKNNLRKDYYDFTMDDKVKYDLPAMINYINSKTNGKKISYFSHSQGSTIFFMLYMHNPKLVESSIENFFSVGTVPNIANAAFTPIKFLDTIYGIFKFLHFKDGILNLSDEQRLAVSNFCKNLPNICKTFFELGACIRPSGKTDYNKVYNFMYYYPGGTSQKNLLHWSQIHTEKKLVYFNENYEKEKTAIPYNIENLKNWKIKALVVRTDDDTFSSYEDVTQFYNLIKDKSYVKILDVKNYGHLDVLNADSAYNDIFLPLIEFLKN
jgi:pimeloyl-ACP methyl ester carboxylesterase